MYHFKKLIKFTMSLGLVLSILAGCSSSDPTTVAADFSALGIKGKVDGQNVMLDLTELGNCAVDINNMTVQAESYGFAISPDPRVARDYSKPVDFTITAPDGTSATYKVTVKAEGCIPTPAPAPAPVPAPLPEPVKNTPLVLGSLTCTPVNAIPMAQGLPTATMNCKITATDPDGIASYKFTFEDSSRVATEYPNTLINPQNTGSTYTVQIVCSGDFEESTNYLTFFATGKKPDGSLEGLQSKELVLTISQICGVNAG